MSAAHQVRAERLLLGVPEGVHEDLVVSDGDGEDLGTQIEGAALEHDAELVVHARALRERAVHDQEGFSQ